MPPPPTDQTSLHACTHARRNWRTLQALEMWLLATITHCMPCFTSVGMARSVNTISAGKNPFFPTHTDTSTTAKSGDQITVSGKRKKF